MLPDEFVLYGHIGREGHYFHLHSNPRTTKLYSDAAVYHVTLHRVKAGEPQGQYWGWWDYDTEFRKAGLSMVYPHRVLFDMCFPYGPEAVVKAGQGEIVNLRLVRAST